MERRVNLVRIGRTVIRLPRTRATMPSMLSGILREYKRGRRFESDEMEKLFQRYVLQANKIHLTHLLGLLIATLVVMFLGLVLIFGFSPSSGDKSKLRRHDTVTVVCVVIAIMIFIFSLAGVVFHKRTNEGFLLYISYALTATFITLEMTFLRNAANLWATAFFVYITYALLPIRLLEATISGLCLSLVHLPPLQQESSFTGYTHSNDERLVNMMLLLAANVVGVLTHFPADMAKRKAFEEIREYVKIKITIHKETVRQQRLLMSVLPEHLIEEMKVDLAKESGSISKRKIYMKTYEPVSILFADIVGFTSLADRSPGSFVVQLLNELYCGFDKSARKNRCMRIKLLGDCYYCVCGLPKPSAYHASHCVDMGLEMLYTMQCVREKFNVDVDIRVGIHTGKLQCGVLGLKKWQFDIWSSDVELANNLESGGVPGKVHISEATKKCLIDMSDTYIIEPAYGSTREPALKDMETFFVTPSHKGKVRIMQRVSLHGPASHVSKTEGDPTIPFFNPMKRERDIEREVIATLYNSINSRSIRRLKKTNCKSTVLRFKDINMERRYNQEPDQMLDAYFVAAAVIFLTMTIVQLLAMPGTPMLYLCSAIGLFWITLSTYLIMAWKCDSSTCCPRPFTRLSRRIDRSRNLAQFLALLTVLLSYIVIAIPMVMEESYVCRSRPDIKQAEQRSLTPMGPIRDNPMNETCIVKTLPYPEHTLLYTILIMIMTGAFQIVMFMFKLLVLLGLCTTYAVLLITARYFMKSGIVAEAAIKYFLMIMALASFLLLMLIQSQQSEIVHRLDFVWKMNARSDSENAQQLQTFNQKLLENILPAHVAKHYLERERPTDELYHEECPSACILFACITNFSFADVDGVDSELNVAILHDIISDIDELLNHPLFSSIEKIKSTGAIYMAASGLSLKEDYENSNEHVVEMAYFALTLLSHIREINQRHDTNFGIKIGICMGPVVAGVIGASMPQYDIWGNTVNVASRMYSTGIENHIQITQNVATVVKKNGFTVKERGSVYVKGKGSMITYFLTGGPSEEELMQRIREVQGPQPPADSAKGPQGRRGWRFSKDNRSVVLGGSPPTRSGRRSSLVGSKPADPTKNTQVFQTTITNPQAQNEPDRTSQTSVSQNVRNSITSRSSSRRASLQEDKESKISSLSDPGNSNAEIPQPPTTPPSTRGVPPQDTPAPLPTQGPSPRKYNRTRVNFAGDESPRTGTHTSTNSARSNKWQSHNSTGEERIEMPEAGGSHDSGEHLRHHFFAWLWASLMRHFRSIY